MKRLLTLRNMIKSTTGVITVMAPGYKPRNIQAIVEYIIKYFNENCSDQEGYWKSNKSVMFYIDSDNIYDFVDKMLKGCKEFNELNLSQYEVDRGITVDDSSRPAWVIGGTSTGDHLKEYYDFIDIDACVRNISGELYWGFLDNDLYEGKVEIVNISEAAE